MPRRRELVKFPKPYRKLYNQHATRLSSKIDSLFFIKIKIILAFTKIGRNLAIEIKTTEKMQDLKIGLGSKIVKQINDTHTDLLYIEVIDIDDVKEVYELIEVSEQSGHMFRETVFMEKSKLDALLNNGYYIPYEAPSVKILAEYLDNMEHLASIKNIKSDAVGKTCEVIIQMLRVELISSSDHMKSGLMKSIELIKSFGY